MTGRLFFTFINQTTEIANSSRTEDRMNIKVKVKTQRETKFRKSEKPLKES